MKTNSVAYTFLIASSVTFTLNSLQLKYSPCWAVVVQSLILLDHTKMLKCGCSEHKVSFFFLNIFVMRVRNEFNFICKNVLKISDLIDNSWAFSSLDIVILILPVDFQIFFNMTLTVVTAQLYSKYSFSTLEHWQVLTLTIVLPVTQCLVSITIANW